MTETSLIDRIREFNADRDPDLVKLKYSKMQESPFGFFRGTCHLFYEDWDRDSELNKAPLSWLCGDLHLQNFGSYKGDNRVVYFDINDFDESVLAPCSLDLIRLLTSIFLAFPHYQEEDENVSHLADIFLDSYRQEIIEAKARWFDRRTATGLVRELLEEKETRKRKKFLDERTEIEDDRRKIIIEENKTRPILSTTKKTIETALKEFAKSTDDPDFFQVIDITERIAGNGSLGGKRYLVLVKGKGSPDDNYLLDIKSTRSPSAIEYISYINSYQPQWQNEAERIISIQQKMQAIAPAFLHTLPIDKDYYVMRELQPSEDKIEWEDNNYGFNKINELIADIGKIVAWAQLRSSGRKGSADADELIGFVTENKWQKLSLQYARDYSKKVVKDWQEFCKSIEDIQAI
jgi:uncharacterized protein (DUF2252 family)